jgi:hypothetical protein
MALGQVERWLVDRMADGLVLVAMMAGSSGLCSLRWSGTVAELSQGIRSSLRSSAEGQRDAPQSQNHLATFTYVTIFHHVIKKLSKFRVAL